MAGEEMELRKKLQALYPVCEPDIVEDITAAVDAALSAQSSRLSRAVRALESVKESLEILFSEDDNPIPQDSIAMGVMKGIFMGVPAKVDKALRELAAGVGGE